MFVKAPIKSRPSGQLVHVPGEEMGRQITHPGTKPVTQFESGPTPGRGPNQYVCHTSPQDYVVMNVSKWVDMQGIHPPTASRWFREGYRCPRVRSGV